MQDLLPWVAAWVLPDDRDRFLYVAGVLLMSTLGFASLLAYCRPAGFWVRKSGPWSARPVLQRHILMLVPLLLLGAQWALVFFSPGTAALALGAIPSALLLLADVVALGVAWALYFPSPDGSTADLSHYDDAGTSGSRSPAAFHTGIRGRLRSLAATPLCRAAGHGTVLLATIVLLYVPDYPSLAGRFMESEGFHHWDFFAAAPVYAYLRGLTPVVDSVTQYGLGIPVILGTIFQIGDNFSYANLIWLGMMLVICYFLGLYLLLYLLLRDFRWSVVGLLLALQLQQFSGLGLDTGTVLLRFPSSTILRWPLDAALFTMLVLHSRSSRWLYLALGGLLTGVAAFWETDTGLYLYLGYLAYCAFLFIQRWFRTQTPGRGYLARLLAAAALPPLVFAGLVLLTYGNNAFSLEFWQQATEPMRRFASGFGMLPIPAPEPANLFIYLTPAVYVATCVAALASAARLLPWRWHFSCVVGSIGVYGLALFNQYVGRSHPYNWYHVCIPLVVLLTMWACLLHRRGVPVFSSRHLPTIILCALVGLLATNGEFRAYPNLLASQPTVESVLWDFPQAGFRTTSHNMVPKFREAVSRIQALVPPDQRLFVMSQRDNLYYILSDRIPLTRYVPLYLQVITWQNVEEVLAALRGNGLRYVFTEPCEADYCNELQSALLPYIQREFTYVERTGDLYVWQRKGTGPAPAPAVAARVRIPDPWYASPPEDLTKVAPGQFLANGLELVGYTPQTVDGQTVTLATYWRVTREDWAGTPYYLYNAFLHVYDHSGQRIEVAAEAELPLATLWHAGDHLVVPLRLTTKTPLARGLYRLEAGVYVRSPQRAPLPAHEGSVPVASLGMVRLGPVAAPSDGQVAEFGDAIRLVSAGVERQGGQLAVSLAWQSKAPVLRDFTVFAHVYDSQGKLVGQNDGWPSDGNYPTSAWQPGEYVAEKRLVSLPANLAPGAYTVKVGLYDSKTVERLAPSPDHGDRAVVVGRLDLGP